MKKTIGILGGGLAGLSLAYFLDKDKYEITVLEKEALSGGLLRTYEHQGFYFDLGGHIIFSKNQGVLDFMLEVLGDNKIKRYRNNSICYNGRYIKYPFENGLSQLKKTETFECLLSYLLNKITSKKKPANFGEFLYYHFGRAITEKYLWPYNQKIWNVNPAAMSARWAEERLPQPAVWDVVKGGCGLNSEGYKHQLHFYYPKSGGIQALAESLENKIKISGVKVINNFLIEKISRAGKYRVAGGRQVYEFDEIINTLPVHNFFKAWENTPAEILKALANLSYNSLIVVGLGIKREKLTDKFAVYYPGKNMLTHRACFNKYLSDSMCPPGVSAIQAEITVNQGDGVYELSDREISQRVIEDFVENKFIAEDEVMAIKVMRAEYAYMVPNLSYDKNKKIVYDYLLSRNLPTCGRFAEFEYLNMDSVIEHAQDLAAELNKSSTFIAGY